MKNKSLQKSFFQCFAVMLAVLGMASCAFGASQTWTNAPVSVYWTNVNNWVGKAVPGNVNQTANNTGSGDTATFNSPIPVSGIGGASLPIAPDDATNGGRARGVSGITFDTINCGAYVIASSTPPSGQSNGVLYVSHNGTIQITAPVTNNQTILEPMFVFLPSSTDGKYTLLNNSTNQNVALTINSLTWGGTSSRSVNFVLDGTSTANNTITNISNNTSTGGGGITKQGSGTWTIAGPGAQSSTKAININDGILAVLDQGAFGTATTVTVNSNAQLRVENSINPTNANFTVQRNGTIKVDGSSTLRGLTVGTAASGTSPNLVTTSSGNVITVGDTTNKVTGGASDSVIHIAGPGTVLLPYGNSGYVGKWSVDAGTLSISNAGALGTGQNISIAAGAALNITNLGAVTWNPTTTGIGGSGTGTAVGSTAGNILADPAATIDLATGAKTINLTFTPTAFSGDLTHPSLYVSQGSLSLGGNGFSINNAGGTALANGTYKLIEQASGTIASTGGYSVIGVTGSGVVSGSVASIQVTGGEVDLVVSSYVSKDLVWSGTGSAWDIATTSDWLDGASASVFNNSDYVTFNDVGSANPTVTLAGTVSPGSVVVSNSVNYTLTGAGSIAGASSLTKAGSGTLTLSTVNSYGGGTVISNGVLQVGAANAIPSVGSGSVQVVSPGVLDLNARNQVINGLLGNGTVDTVAGSSPVLTVGNNDASGTFGGLLQNTAGTLNVTKVGSGTEILTGANTFSGATTVNAGVLALSNLNALGSSALTLSGGSVDLQSSLNLVSLTGGSGGIANSTTNSVTLTITGGAATTFSGFIWDGSGGGKVALTVLGPTSLTMGGDNSYSGGTIVGSGASFAIPNGGAPNNANVRGTLIASNLATLSLSGGGTTPGTPSNITTVDGATVTFRSGALGKIWGGQFQGSVNTTNRILDTMSFGGDTSFKNFSGVVNLEGTGSFRFINIPAGTAGGGDAAIFNFPSSGSMSVVTRDAATVRLGSIVGGNDVSGIAQATTAGITDTYVIGGRNTDCSFGGFIRGLNNIVKIGTAQLTLNGGTYPVVTLDESFNLVTNLVYTNLITYVGNTTISNGVLALAAPVVITNSPVVTLASATAVLDASQMGYVDVTLTNLVTNGVFEVVSGQTLAGIGTIRASKVLLDSGSIFNVGLPVGSLTATNEVELAGQVNMRLSTTNSPNSSEVICPGAVVIDPTATLDVTNVGPALAAGDTFQLFSHAITGSFAATNLPVLASPLYWTNKLAVDGSLAVASLVNTSPTNLTTSVSGGNLTLTWPADHTGWRLQSQTNTLTAGLATNWVDVAGAAATNQVVVPMDSVNGSVFFRMVYP